MNTAAYIVALVLALALLAVGWFFWLQPPEPVNWGEAYADLGYEPSLHELGIWVLEGPRDQFMINSIGSNGEGDCRGAVLLDLCWSHWRAEDEAEAAAATSEWWGGEAA